MISLNQSGIFRELDSLRKWLKLGSQRTSQGSWISLLVLTSNIFRLLVVALGCLHGLVGLNFFLISSALLGLKFVCFSFKYASTSITTTPISEMATWLAAVLLCFLYAAGVCVLWWWLTSCWGSGCLWGCVAGQQ